MAPTHAEQRAPRRSVRRPSPQSSGAGWSADGRGSTPGAQRARPSRAVAGSGRSLGRVIAKCDPRGGRLVAGPAGVLRDERKLLRMKRFAHRAACPFRGVLRTVAHAYCEGSVAIRLSEDCRRSECWEKDSPLRTLVKGEGLLSSATPYGDQSENAERMPFDSAWLLCSNDHKSDRFRTSVVVAPLAKQSMHSRQHREPRAHELKGIVTLFESGSPPSPRLLLRPPPRSAREPGQ